MLAPFWASPIYAWNFVLHRASFAAVACSEPPGYSAFLSNTWYAGRSTTVSEWSVSLLQGEYAGGKKCSKAVRLTKDTDFSKMRVAQMRDILRDRGIVCRECAEKQDYIAKLKELVKDS